MEKLILRWLIAILLPLSISSALFAAKGPLYYSSDRVIEEKPTYPLPTPADTSNLGLHLARSMRLLSSSTPRHHNIVRILFYGQSITRQDWWKDVTADLQHRFPNAIIVAKNLAIGGFPSQLLVLNADRDLLSFYPDLIIFHVYGAHDAYEQLIVKMRTLTTADIAMQTDHYDGRSDPNQLDTGWTAFMNEHFLPKIAQRYRCELVDVRSGWRQYLLENHYQPNQLLIDGVHLNAQGRFLMAKLVEPYLIANPKAVDDWSDRVKLYKIGKDVRFKNSRLTLNFIGNRVDAIAGSSGRTEARVLIDGKRPSEIPELYVFTRANAGVSRDWPWDVSAPLRISWNKPPVDEDWRLIVTSVQTVLEGNEKKLHFTFKLIGSKTGLDGQGTNVEKFVSSSGRVVILPQDWWLSTGRGKKSPIKPGYELKFHSMLLGTDVYRMPPVESPTHESAVTLAQGLKNEKHTLQLIVDGSRDVPITAIRVYKPPLIEANVRGHSVIDEVKPNKSYGQ
ncbi:MAG: hypothetical protein JO235_04500 [Chroococcidiopsidaceae cyanobacterium CP_BM_RX_35]|nr:hypothetical protein [Chroococcidiopsidaceae cyanobacterium CP_BM_RX_35]